MDAAHSNSLKTIRFVFLYFLFASPYVAASHGGEYHWYDIRNQDQYETFEECANAVAVCGDLQLGCTCTITSVTPTSPPNLPPGVKVLYLRTVGALGWKPGDPCLSSLITGCTALYTFAGNCALNKQWQPDGELQIETSGGSGCGVTVKVPQKERPCQNGSQVGNPINCASGIKTQTEVDYRSLGPYPLIVQRHYSSFQFDTAGDTSPVSAQDLRLLENEFAIRFKYRSNLQLAEIFWPDGGHYAFNLVNTNGSIGYSDRDSKGYVQKVSAFIYDYYDLSGRRYRFDNIGRLTSITEPNGYQKTVSYVSSSSTIINSIADSFARTLTYSYDTSAQPKLISIQLPDGKLIKYTYDSQNRMDSVIYPDETSGTDADNPRRLYHYENSIFSKSLTGITDENGIRFSTWAYDNDGRAISSEHAGGAEKVTLNYTSAIETEVRFYRSSSDYRQSTYTHQTLNGREVITEIQTSPCSNCAVGAETRQYGSDGFLQSLTDVNGNVTQYVHNARGLETNRIEAYGTPLARTITTTWHSTFDLPTQISEPGRTISFNYDASGNRLTRTETDTALTPNVSRTTTYTYNSFGQVLTADGPRSDVTDVTTYAYNSAGNLTSITNALNQQTQFTSYDAHGNPLTIIDPNGVTTILIYDARQNLMSRTVAASTADAATTSFEYYPTNKLKKIVQPDGSYLLYTYDNAQRLIKVQDNLDNYISYTLDVAGNRTEEKVYDPSDVLVKTRTSVFNNLSRLIETVSGASQSTEYTYDAKGNLTGITDPGNNTTSNTFDALSRLIKTVDPQNGATNPTEYSYDSRDNLSSVEDPRGLVTQYQYNGFGELIQQASPDTGITAYAYDAAGNRSAQTDARGVTTTYHYDALNRLIQIGYPDPAENVYFDYDEGSYGIGRLRRITDATGATEYEYDARGNVVEAVYHRVINGQPQSYTVGYQYDAADRLTQLTYPSGRTVNFTRDSAGRITAVSTNWHDHNNTLAQSIDYLPFGPLSQLTYGNGLVDSRGFDQDFRITEINVDATTLEYGYDPNGNIGYIENTPNTVDSQIFDYDLLNRLTEATGPYGLRDYVYDPVGNRLSETDDTQTETYVYDLDSNQLAQRGAVQYQYDSAGNIIDNGQYTFLYNLAGRLGAVQAGGVPVAYYLYNGLGQRAVKTVGNTARVYIYDLNGLLLSEIDLARNTHVEYVYLDGRPLAQITPRPDLWAPELEHVLTDVQDPNQTATVSLDTTTQTLEFAFSGGGGQTYVNPPEWDETHFDNQRYLAIGDPQTGASSGYAVEYSLYLHEASIQVVLHLTPKAGGPERVFILETSTSGLPPIAYYHTDHLGTPKALTDQAQQLVWWGEYEPFGKVNITTEQVTNNLRFPGQYFDAETELHYNYFRDYDPRIGRYVESDPIGLDGGLNTYGYTQNNPINFSDPQGLKRVPCPEGMPKSAVCDDGKDNQNEPARCVTAECAAGLPPAKFDMRSIEEIDCSQCLFTCNLASLGFPSPLPTTVMKTIFFIEIGATTTGLCGLVCQEKCSKCN